MEIRINLPDSLPAFKYIVKNPRSLLIGKYGFNEWLNMRNAYLEEKRRHRILLDKYQKLSKRTAHISKELSALKRNA